MSFWYRVKIITICIQIAGKFIKFVPVTLVPFEPSLIDFTLMGPSQIQWYNSYNQLIKDNILPRLQEDEDTRALQWVIKRIKPVDPWIGFKNDL